ncbi:PTS-dependent dihydroxyacetone kinase phosphotransferase subunit DhaM [Oceanobacillus piezotolerans]|uniref:phosphoenolpyruvate--glycerone phosphotransferase n=1 Tax=Oceanobacillus piezotolerans TaxID=2448030 RepID=A0A498DAM4_9BACI|nr:dihydroxyacetone kinase phosphoryl donor subunit DhaM [Oceanobacillus piezotolerans]RLL46628.1 PTS-dependent dihydroxyacetone kinase phosphotransferase subunit DhaM [Oceanobacillus piezotolerans]
MSKVGIVLISHSSKIAEGIYELIRQVIQDVPIELAGGTEDNEIGTSIDKIMKAIQKADQGQGVLLFYDIGSAKMNAEMAIEMTESIQAKLIESPLVEGAYMAAVESGMGKKLQDIYDSVKEEFHCENS